MTREGDDGGFRIAFVENLDVDDFSELGKVVVQMHDVVETGRHLLQFQRAIRRILVARP